MHEKLEYLFKTYFYNIIYCLHKKAHRLAGEILQKIVNKLQGKSHRNKLEINTANEIEKKTAIKSYRKDKF